MKQFKTGETGFAQGKRKAITKEERHHFLSVLLFCIPFLDNFPTRATITRGIFNLHCRMYNEYPQ